MIRDNSGSSRLWLNSAGLDFKVLKVTGRLRTPFELLVLGHMSDLQRGLVYSLNNIIDSDDNIHLEKKSNNWHYSSAKRVY